jgi:serine/threonine protein kinase
MHPASIGPYKIERELGRGGMGEVYLARDTRLDRQVAIKALPAHLAQDQDRLSRFQREAKVLASLNHPGIGAIYGLEEAGGHQYLILEFVEGETLADRLAKGPIPVDESLSLAKQIAEALEVAHEKGVIHRDLKPGNVMVTPDGVVKVLDFGLARTADAAPPTTNTPAPTDSPTVTLPVRFAHSPTMPGVIMGTAGYMSPEQARGKAVDKRSDIFSFGCVLYEMLTGAQPFRGETVADAIGATLHKESDLALLPAATPPTIRLLLSQCLAKDKANRLRDIGDARLALAQAIGDPLGAALGLGGVDLKPQRRGLRPFLIMGMAGTTLIAGVAGTAAWFASKASQSQPERTIRKFEILSMGPDEKFETSSPTISPDGMKIAFIHSDAVKVRDLSNFDVVTIAQAKNIRQLAWSADSKTLIYAVHGELFRVGATGGGAVKLGDHSVNFPFAWTSKDRLVFAKAIDDKLMTPGIVELPARGGTTRVLLEADKKDVVDFHAVATIPGTDVLLFVRHRTDLRTPIEAWDGSKSVVIADFDDQYLSAPVWSPSGHVLFARGFGKLDLWAVPFSPKSMEVTGDPFLIQPDASAPSISTQGTLSFVRGSGASSGEIVWVLPDGTIEVIGDGGEVVMGPLVSPDGSRVAFAGGPRPTDLEIWVRDLERGINTRISSLDGFVIPVAWSPDGREIAVANLNLAPGENSESTNFLAADGSGPTRKPYPGLLTSFDANWKRAVRVSDPRRGESVLAAVELDQMTEIGRVVSKISGDIGDSLSRDGELLLYVLWETGEPQVYCTRFPSGEGRWQVSGDGGSQPHWSSDGSSVYYTNTDRELIRVPLTREPAIRFGLPEKVFQVSPKTAEIREVVRASGDKRFIAVRERNKDVNKAGYKLLLIENWYEEFRQNRGR